MSFLSLAERMALKGKKVKIRQRQSRDAPGAAKTGSPATQTAAGTGSATGSPAVNRSVTATPALASAKDAEMPDIGNIGESNATKTPASKTGRKEREDEEDFTPAPEGDADESESSATTESEPEPH
ncbi:hypothetical protein DL768_008166 [Monosporascus sp. mg162]|nr:hypothetical protein DL768_008166 [Monosporascus sp. mg162]